MPSSPVRSFLIGTLILTFAAVQTEQEAAAQQTGAGYPQRKLLGMKSDSEAFQKVVAAIRDPSTPVVKDSEVRRSDIYFRLTEKRFVVTDEGAVNEHAILGGSPYVFLTIPQAAYGRSLYGIYSDLGYGAEGVLRQRDVPMAALVIRYRNDVAYSDVRDGNGPLNGDQFKSFVYTPTWKNGMALFARLAGEVAPQGAPFYAYLNFESPADRNLARFFPAERRKQIEELPYPLLRAVGGPDWRYRQLLETKMGMNSHFRGVGRTENTLSPASDRAGLPEFVGPNRKLTELHDYAVIDMGRMAFVEVHD